MSMKSCNLMQIFCEQKTFSSEFSFESTETGRLPSGCSHDARGGWRRFTGISHRLNADRFEVKFQGSWRLQTHFRNKWKSNTTFSNMFHIGVTKIGSWSEYILLQTRSYWTCSAWKRLRLLDAVFSNVKLPLWPVLYSGCGVSLGPCRLVGEEFNMLVTNHE